ncbi:MAG: chromate transporter [Ruminococcaceae bacterium]|nr:chromate transporter [Oscillospiraceae bacterium]
MLLNLFLMFLKLGFLSVGGGYPMMGLILQEGAAVGLTAGEFADMAALELLASGPIAINSATYIGFIKAGFLGAVVATVGVCIPPIILTTILYHFLKRFSLNPYVNAFLEAIKIACGGVLLATALTLSREIVLGGETWLAAAANPFATVSWWSVLIMAAGVFALQKFKANPIVIILLSGLVGAFVL